MRASLTIIHPSLNYEHTDTSLFLCNCEKGVIKSRKSIFTFRTLCCINRVDDVSESYLKRFPHEAQNRILWQISLMRGRLSTAGMCMLLIYISRYGKSMSKQKYAASLNFAASVPAWAFESIKSAIVYHMIKWRPGVEYSKRALEWVMRCNPPSRSRNALRWWEASRITLLLSSGAPF